MSDLSHLNLGSACEDLEKYYERVRELDNDIFNDVLKKDKDRRNYIADTLQDIQNNFHNPLFSFSKCSSSSRYEDKVNGVNDAIGGNLFKNFISLSYF